MNATVIITTKNRSLQLINCLKSIFKQSIRPQIIVVDDGSTDETSSIVKNKYPSVKLIRSNVSKGIVFQRDFATRMAKGNVIFSIDDDAEYSDKHTIMKTLNDFTSDKIAAIAIPCFDKGINQRLTLRPPTSNIFLVPKFNGSAYAIRKTIYLKIGGYRNFLFQQYEEGDLCIRLYGNGYYIRLGTAGDVIHYGSPIKNINQKHYFSARNHILYSFLNEPLLIVPFHLAVSIKNLLLLAIKTNRPEILMGLSSGIFEAFKLREIRTPLKFKTYIKYKKLLSSQYLEMPHFNTSEQN